MPIDADERLPLFVFGTLRRGECNHHYLAGRYVECVPAVLPGYAVVDELMIAPRPGREVPGELFTLDPDRYVETLRGCDDLEEIPPGTLAGDWYRRAVVTVRTEEGEVRAWAYPTSRDL